MKKVDIAIVGAGPAGISAAINAKIRNKSILLFGKKDLSHKVNISKEIRNYIGFPTLSGKELNQNFQKHLDQMDIEITQKNITTIYKMKDHFILLANTEEYEADALIIATGAETIKPLSGERELLGKGVSYCATCDGNLYKEKVIAVYCDSKENEHEVDYLSQIAEKVYYFPQFPSTYSMNNVVKPNSSLLKINGENCVESIELKDGTNINVDGVFVLKQSLAADVLLRKLEINKGHIVVNREMKTNIEGCFACGDCVGLPYQIAKAIGEGNIASHSAMSYLSKKEIHNGKTNQ